MDYYRSDQEEPSFSAANEDEEAEPFFAYKSIAVPAKKSDNEQTKKLGRAAEELLNLSTR